MLSSEGVAAASFAAFMTGGTWFSNLLFQQAWLNAKKQQKDVIKKVPFVTGLASSALLAAVFGITVGFVHEVFKIFATPAVIAPYVPSFLGSTVILAPFCVIFLFCTFHALATLDMVIWEGCSLKYWFIIVSAKYAQLFSALAAYQVSVSYFG